MDRARSSKRRELPATIVRHYDLTNLEVTFPIGCSTLARTVRGRRIASLISQVWPVYSIRTFSSCSSQPAEVLNHAVSLGVHANEVVSETSQRCGPLLLLGLNDRNLAEEGDREWSPWRRELTRRSNQITAGVTLLRSVHWLWTIFKFDSRQQIRESSKKVRCPVSLVGHALWQGNDSRSPPVCASAIGLPAARI